MERSQDDNATQERTVHMEKQTLRTKKTNGKGRFQTRLFDS